uniref:Uncharacterized protein n=1 Tax=Lactuca sativa TaxID=4236 RepID=A0A9R1VD56_LACSA|nr:hypothetical protein LSAT_V11C500296240 [Lactuca sativa]
MDTQILTGSLHYMDQEFAKLNRFDGRNYTRWANTVRFMLHVLKLSYVLDPKLTSIPGDPIPEVGSMIFTRRSKIREGYGGLWNSCTRHMRKVEFQMADNKPILEQVHEFQVIVNKLSALSIFIPELILVGAIITKMPPSWKDFSNRVVQKSKDYLLLGRYHETPSY